MFRITAAVALASVPVAAQNLVTNDYEHGANPVEWARERDRREVRVGEHV